MPASVRFRLLVPCLSALVVGGCCVPCHAGTEPATVAEPVPEAVPAPPAEAALTLVAGPTRALADGVTYELRQFDPVAGNGTTRLVDLPAPDGPSPVYPGLDANPPTYRAKVIGWVFVELLSDGTRIQRWLLLHEMKMASQQDIEIRPAAYMGGTFSAPATVSTFTARAQQIFEAAKLSSPDPPRDRTRYVKVKNVPKVPHLAPNLPTMIPPTNVGSEPIYPTPLGNGSWDGILAGQMDGGTVAIYKKGATSPSLIGWMVESNNGTAGHESWFIDDGFPEPTVGNPIIVGSRNYTTSAGIGTPVDLSEPSGSNLEWNLLREAATYYSVSFPNDP